MNNEKNIPTIEFRLETMEVNSQVRKIKLTRRNTFYKGISGRLKCLYYWLRYKKEKEKVTFRDWLDQPVAYTIETPDKDNTKFRINVEKELEHYLVDEVAGEKKQN